MLIEYVFKRKTDGDIQREMFTLDEIEKGSSLEYIETMKNDGYILLNRVFVKHIS